MFNNVAKEICFNFFFVPIILYYLCWRNIDPRYNIELLEYYFPIIYGDEADNEIQRVRDICYEMIRGYSSGSMGREGTRGPCVGEDLQVDDSLMDFERYLS